MIENHSDVREYAVNLLQKLKSVRLAIGLLLYLTLAGGLATLIPQGLDVSYYEGHYSRLVAALILETRFYRFFTSAFFLLPSLLLFVNLTLCTADRFRRELRKKRGPRNFGPDVLHLGLVVLIVGAVMSFSGRQEGYIELSVGDRVELPDDYALTLTDFQYHTYDGGRPRDWISRVNLSRGDALVREGYDIRVNHPLKAGRVKLYQVSHSTRLQLLLEDPAGKLLSLGQGERMTRGGTAFFFMAPDGKDPGPARAVIHRSSHAGTSVVRVGPGDMLEDLLVKNIRAVDITGIEAVTDPGTSVVFASFVLICAGLAMIFIRKLRDLK